MESIKGTATTIQRHPSKILGTGDLLSFGTGELNAMTASCGRGQDLIRAFPSEELITQFTVS